MTGGTQAAKTDETGGAKQDRGADAEEADELTSQGTHSH